MVHLHQTYEVLTGGFYTGNHSWNKKCTEIDNCFKVYFLTEGEVSICDSKQEYLLKKNHLYFINGSKLSYQYSKESFSTRWLHFIPKDLIIHQGLLSLPLVVDLSHTEDELSVPFPNIELILLRNFSSYQTYYIELLRAQTFLQSLIISLLEQYPLKKNELSGDFRRIQAAIKYINDFFMEPIRLEQLAGQCCMSPNYFHKIFTRALNTTPMNYVSLLRMNTALQLLINDECTIKEIAYKLGYSDDAYFSRVFRKYYGITPGEYRKKRGEFIP